MTTRLSGNQIALIEAYVPAALQPKAKTLVHTAITNGDRVTQVTPGFKEAAMSLVKVGLFQRIGPEGPGSYNFELVPQ